VPGLPSGSSSCLMLVGLRWVLRQPSRHVRCQRRRRHRAALTLLRVLGQASPAALRVTPLSPSCSASLATLREWLRAVQRRYFGRLQWPLTLALVLTLRARARALPGPLPSEGGLAWPWAGLPSPRLVVRGRWAYGTPRRRPRRFFLRCCWGRLWGGASVGPSTRRMLRRRCLLGART
jgi:hypothetical protein